MLPTDMTVIETTAPGGPDMLVTARRPLPSPGPDEVLLKVTACGVNGPDLVQRRGHYPPPKGASDLLGLEVSGTVVGRGTGTVRWALGDTVCALTNGGGYADYVAVRADHCLPIPATVDPRDAAGLPETYFTVWSNVFHGHDIPRGGRMLVHGGAGGIGSTAIQLARALGLEVFTTCEASAKAFCTDLGAKQAIDFRSEDFVAILRAAGGADIVLDIIGGDYLAKNIKAARADARLISLAFNAGSKIEIDLMPMMLKRLTLTGSTLRSRPDGFKASVAAALEQVVWPHFATGALAPVTHKVLPLAQAAQAHHLMESAAHHGKILLHP